MTLCTHPLHNFSFLLRLHFRFNLVDTKFTCNALSDFTPVACRNYDVDSIRAQFANGRFR